MRGQAERPVCQGSALRGRGPAGARAPRRAVALRLLCLLRRQQAHDRLVHQEGEGALRHDPQHVGHQPLVEAAQALALQGAGGQGTQLGRKTRLGPASRRQAQGRAGWTEGAAWELPRDFVLRSIGGVRRRLQVWEAGTAQGWPTALRVQKRRPPTLAPCNEQTEVCTSMPRGQARAQCAANRS